MRLTPGTVVGGKVVVEDASLDEGSVVVVLSHDPDGSFTLSAEDEQELLAAIGEIERGEFVPAEALLEGLRKYG
jgi:hypothetical protein